MDDEAMKAMAARIMKEVVPQHNYALRGIAYDAALAAISETQELCAALAEEEIAKHTTGSGFDSQPARTAAHNILSAIRSGQQFRKDV